jgi:hypothetical protein
MHLAYLEHFMNVFKAKVTSVMESRGVGRWHDANPLYYPTVS